MKSHFWSHRKKYLLGVLLVVIGGILAFFILQHLGTLKAGVQSVIGILAPMVYGVIIAYLLDPLCNKLESGLLWLMKPIRCGQKRKHSIAWVTSILLSLLLLLAIVAFLLALVLPQLITSITRLVNAIPGYANDIYNALLPLVERFGLEAELNELGAELSRSMRDWATNTLLPNMNNIITQVSIQVTGVVSGIFNVLVGFVAAFYCLNNRRVFALQGKKLIFATLPHKWAVRVLDRLRYADKVFSGSITGRIIDSLIIGVITFLFCLILRMPYSLLISVVIGVTNIIPFFGPFIGGIPCGLLILIENPLKCLYFVIFLILLQQFDGNILSTRILSSSVGLSSFWVLFSILLFGGLFGVVGMLVGTPLFAVIYSIIRDAVNVLLRHKSLPEEAWRYDNVAALEAAPPGEGGGQPPEPASGASSAAGPDPSTPPQKPE